MPDSADNRVVFLTVGTSAVENARDLAKLVPEVQDIFGDDDVREVVRGMEANAVDLLAVEDLLRSAHERFWSQSNAYKRDTGNYRKTSAEMVSTYLALRTGALQGGDLRAGKDRVILLASDTAIGRLCANINASLIRNHLFFESALTDDIRTVIIEGLNPAEDREQPFRPYRQLETLLLTELMEKDNTGAWISNGAQALFNITGGYKGLIPPITHLAWSERYQSRSSLLYLHESMPQTVVLRPHLDGLGMEEAVYDNRRNCPWAQI